MERHFRVVIADDEDDVRALARRALERSGRFTVVAEAADGQEAIDATAEHHPELTLLDLVMPDADGLQVLPAVRSANPHGTVVVLTGLQQPRLADDALAAGAAGLLTKQASWQQLPTDLLRLLGDSHSEPLGSARKERQVRLPARLTSGRAARKMIRSAVASWELGHVLDEAELLTSELVNNAMLHATSEVQVRLVCEPARLRVEVTDSGTGTLQRRRPELSDVNGRGLMLVDTLASTWGTAANEHGKTVWFELDTSKPAGDATSPRE